MPSFIVRPSVSGNEPFRVHLTAVSLLLLKAKPGDVLLLHPQNADDRKAYAAIAWENSAVKDSVVQLSKFLQDFYSIRLGDRIDITRHGEILREAETVLITPTLPLSEEQQALWRGYLWGTIPLLYSTLAPGMLLKSPGRKENIEFEVVDVGGVLSRITHDTAFEFDKHGSTIRPRKPSGFELTFKGVGGLRPQIEQVTRQIRLLTDDRLATQWPGFPGQHGLLLYGLKGTGKSKFIEALAADQWGDVVRWAPGMKFSSGLYPQLVVADLSTIDTDSRISELTSVFKVTKGTQTLIVGEVKHPNDLNDKLRTDDTFTVELELPVPDSDQRLDILHALRGNALQPSDEQLAQLSSRTHGYVGADLNRLLVEIWISAAERGWKKTMAKSHSQTSNDLEYGQISPPGPYANANNEPDPLHSETGEQEPPLHEQPYTITQEDIESSLPKIRPSALQHIFFEKPNVRWSDIGGQSDLKKQLINAVNRTLDQSLRPLMFQLGVKPPKGVLLYGPPGCSKTLLAKALATETEINFLAIKGAELVSMYVGESERATREVFRKARAAAPCILFFDEIDAIASSSRLSGSSTSSSSELNVVTTLLNEMDGFQELRNVIVVAATNKPQSIDPALLRPGRFDRVVYVGLPDIATRREIFEKRFQNVHLSPHLSENKSHALDDWAARTEGYSGAEIVGICLAAGEAALDNNQDVVTEWNIDEAIVGAPRGVTKAILQEYERWNEERKSRG